MGITLDQVILDANSSNIAISDGTNTLAVNGDGSIDVVLAAGASVQITDGVETLAVNADGSINVNLTDDGVADGAADTGNPLKVGSRAIDGALTAIDSGDRADLLSDLYRRIWVNDSCNIAIANTAETVGTTAVELVSSPLAGRKKITIQNRSNDSIYIGDDNTVTSGTGVEIPKKASLTLELGEDIDIWAIGGSAALDVRVLEAA